MLLNLAMRKMGLLLSWMIFMMLKWKLLIRIRINSLLIKKSKRRMPSLIIGGDNKKFKSFRKRKTIGKKLLKNKNDYF